MSMAAAIHRLPHCEHDMPSRDQHYVSVSSHILAADQLTATEKLVYIAVRSRQGKDVCKASRSTLAADIGGASKATVVRAIQHLVELGWITQSGRFLRCNDTPSIGIGLTPVSNEHRYRIDTAPVSNEHRSGIESTPRTERETLKINAKDKQTPPTPSLASARIPDWIDPATWAAWKDFRRRQKKPLTDRAVSLLVAKLARFRDQGQDPNAIIDQSIERGWTSFFALKTDDHGKPPLPHSKDSHYHVPTTDRLQQFASAVRGRHTPDDGALE